MFIIGKDTRFVKALVLTMVLLLGLASAGCSKGAEVEDEMGEEVITFKFSHHESLQHDYHLVAEQIAQEVEEQTDGRIVIDVFGGGQLGGLKENTDGINSGTIDLAWVDSGSLQTFNPKAGVFALPFMFDSFEHVGRAVDGDVGEAFKEAILEKTNIRLMGVGYAGFRYFASTTPINSVDDMKLLKIRVPEIPLYVNTMRALGASPTPIPWGEIYTSLQTGVVEACEGAPKDLYNSKVHEVTEYLIPTGHIFTDSCLIMNENSFQRLSNTDKEILASVIKANLEIQRAGASKLNEDAVEKMLEEGGMTLLDIDKSAFVEKVAPVWDEFNSKYDAAQFIDAIVKVK